MSEQYYNFPVETLLPGGSVLPFDGVDLDNYIHPLFARHNFPCTGTGYDALVPALKLASLLISTDCLLNYWWTRDYAPQNPPRSYPQGSGMEDETYTSVVPVTRKLSAREAALVKLQFLNLANIIKFHRDEEWAPAEGATTLRGDSDMCNINSGCPGFPSKCSSVLYSEELYQNTVQSHRGTDEQSTRQYLLHCFQLAKLLCHELAHVCQHAHKGDVDDIPIGDNKLAEAGFDWEAWTFGGCVQYLTGEGTSMFEWPNGLTLNSYLRNGSPIFVCGRLPEATVQWRIPESSIFQLFTKRFWNEVVPAEGAKALQLPKVLGYRFIPAKCKCATCQVDNKWDGLDLTKRYDLWSVPASAECYGRSIHAASPPLPTDDDASLGAFVPHGYAVLVDGRIVRQEDLERVGKPRIVCTMTEKSGEKVLVTSDGSHWRHEDVARQHGWEGDRMEWRGQWIGEAQGPS